uniref:TPR_REGION domain-containing protein n=1 Tax=Caenorhabditis tropicalis TaxID=1561998 RepID=A0A1I7U5N6_9PELO
MSMFFKKKSKKATLESAHIVKMATNRLYSESESGQDSDTLVGGNSSQLVPGVYLNHTGIPDSTFVNAPSSGPESSSQSTRVIDVIPEIGTVPASDFFSAFFTRPGDPLPLWQVVTDGKIRWMKYAHSSLAKPQLSPAKDHELVEAEERMKEYLAGLQLKLPPSASLNIKLKKSDDSEDKKQGSQSKPAEETSQKDHPSNVGKAPIQTSPAREHEIEEAQKLMDDYFAKLNEKHMIAAQATPSTVISSPDVSLTTPTTAFLATKNDEKKLLAVVQSQESIPKPTAPPPNFENQISPAKADEIAEAKRRMDAFLATKNAGKKLLAVFQPQESVVTPTVPLPPTTKQISPAKENEIAAAQRRMDEYLAKQTAAASKPLATTAIVQTVVSKEPTVLVKPKVSGQDARFKSSKNLSPARPDEIAEAQKRMDAFLANKAGAKKALQVTPQAAPEVKVNSAPGKVLPTLSKPNNIDVEKAMTTPVKTAPPASSEELIVPETDVATAKKLNVTPATKEEIEEANRMMESILKQLQYFKEEKQNRPANKDEIAEAERRMQEFLEKQSGGGFPVVPAIHRATRLSSTAFSDSSADTVRAVSPTLRPTLAGLMSSQKLSTPEQSLFSFSEKDQLGYAEQQMLKSPEVFDTPDGKKRISSPTKFCSPLADSCDTTIEPSPARTESPEVVKRTVYLEVPDPNKKTIEVKPLEGRWLGMQMGKLFGRHVPIQPRSVAAPQVFQPVAPSLPSAPPIPTFAPLSDSVCAKKLMAQLKVLEEDHNKKMAGKLGMPATTQSPVRMRPCISKLDMLENVPDYIEHSRTPCQTPLKMRLDKNERPRRFAMTVKGIFRKRIVQLVAPIRRRSSVTFGDAPDFSRPQSFNDSVTEGSSGFRVLSVVDHETNKIRFPKYNAPGTSTQH